MPMTPYTHPRPGKTPEVLFHFFAVYAQPGSGTVHVDETQKGTDWPPLSGPSLTVILNDPHRDYIREGGVPFLVETEALAAELVGLGIDEGRIIVEPNVLTFT